MSTVEVHTKSPETVDASDFLSQAQAEILISCKDIKDLQGLAYEIVRKMAIERMVAEVIDGKKDQLEIWYPRQNLDEEETFWPKLVDVQAKKLNHAFAKEETARIARKPVFRLVVQLLSAGKLTPAKIHTASEVGKSLSAQFAFSMNGTGRDSASFTAQDGSVLEMPLNKLTFGRKDDTVIKGAA